MGQLDNRRRYWKKAAEVEPALDWLKFTAKSAGTFTLTIPANLGTSYITSISYSTNNGVTWTTINNSSSEVVITTPTIQAGSSVFWKGIANAFSAWVNSTWNYATFSSTVNFDVSGNIMSLLYGDNFEGQTSLNGKIYAFQKLFYNAKVVNAKDVLLPATTLAVYCYAYMFSGCTSLTSNISLPAQTMADSCYDSMFKNCTNITYAKIYAVTLESYCFNWMFEGCSKLSIVDVRYVTTAITAKNYSNQNYTNGWLYNIKTTGTLYAPRVWRIDLMKGRTNGYPSGWTVYTY